MSPRLPKAVQQPRHELQSILRILSRAMLKVDVYISTTLPKVLVGILTGAHVEAWEVPIVFGGCYMPRYIIR